MASRVATSPRSICYPAGRDSHGRGELGLDEAVTLSLLGESVPVLPRRTGRSACGYTYDLPVLPTS